MIIILLGRLGQIILSFLSVKLATTVLSTTTYGQISLFLALVSGFSLVLINPVGMYINRRLNDWNRERKIVNYFLYYGYYLLIVSIFAIIFCSIFYFFNISFVKNVDLSWLLIIIGLSLFFNTINQTFIPSLNLLGFRNWFVGLTLLTVLVSLITSLSLVFFIKPSAELWQLGQILGQTLIGIISGILFFKLITYGKANIKNKIPKINNILLFSTPIAFSVGLTWVQTQSYRFIVSEKIGLDTLGLFFAGYSIGTVIIATFESIVTNYFLPKFYQELSGNNDKEYGKIWEKYAKSIFPVLLLTMVFIIVFSPELTRVLLSDKFQSASHYVLWGALAETGRIIVSTYSYISHAKMNTRSLVLPNVIGAVVSLFFVFILIPLFNINGVGLALVLASISVIITMQFTIVKKSTMIFPYGYLLKPALLSLLFIVVVVIAKQTITYALNFQNALLWLATFGFLYLLLAYNLLKDSMRET